MFDAQNVWMFSNKSHKKKKKRKMREYNYSSANSKKHFLKNNTHLFEDKIKKNKKPFKNEINL